MERAIVSIATYVITYVDFVGVARSVTINSRFWHLSHIFQTLGPLKALSRTQFNLFTPSFCDLEPDSPLYTHHLALPIFVLLPRLCTQEAKRFFRDFP